MKNNTDLLRPFDLEAAQRGEPILWGGQFEPATFVARARKGKTNIIERAGMHAGLLDHVEYAPDEYLHMAPLCWVEGRPVYKGDRLWCKLYNEWVTATGSRQDGVLNADGHEPGLDLDVRACTWSAPKVRRKVKLLAYLDADQLFWLRETATPKFPAARVPFEDRIVEVEEPADQIGGEA